MKTIVIQNYFIVLKISYNVKNSVKPQDVAIFYLFCKKMFNLRMKTQTQVINRLLQPLNRSQECFCNNWLNVQNKVEIRSVSNFIRINFNFWGIKFDYNHYKIKELFQSRWIL